MASNPNLYKWERKFNKPSTHSSSKPHKNHGLNGDDINSWMKRVEIATEFAAAEAFSKAKSKTGNSRAAVEATVDQLHDHDSAFSEAQQLLSDWFADKDPLLQAEPSANIWSDEEDSKETFEPSIQNIIQETDAGAISMEDYERLMNLDAYDEDSAVTDFLGQLKNKSVIRPDFFTDLGEINGLERKQLPRKDPTIKMEARHLQVKENREKKRQELLRKQKEDRMRRDALQAEKHKVAQARIEAQKKSKREELEIQKEMARIRKELQEDRREQLRNQEEERELEARIAQVERQQRLESQATARSDKSSHLSSNNTDQDNQATARGTPSALSTGRSGTSDLARKRTLVVALETAEKKFVTHSIQLKRKCFTAWFEVLMESRLKMGKARAVSDLRYMYKAWNTWRHHVRDQQFERAQVQHHSNIRDEQLKNTRAVEYDRIQTLRRYFTQWHLWSNQQQNSKQLQHQHSSRKEKMATFLNKMAESKLEIDSRKAEDAKTKRTEKAVEDLFNSKKKGSAPRQSVKPINKRLPTEAWQVTRKHLQLSNKEVRAITDAPGDSDDESVDAFTMATSELSTSRSKRANSGGATPKSFENRFNAQQRILHDQQKAIKEQKKLIEELKYSKGQNLLEEQIKQQEVIQQQLEKLTKLALQERNLNQVVPKFPSKPQLDNSPSNALQIDLDTPRTDQASAASEPPTTARSIASSAVSRHSTFSRRMEERAAERQRLKEERETKRREQEAQRVAEIQAREEELQKQELDEKRQRLEAYKEKKRAEKEREFERQLLKEKLINDMKKADEHSKLRCLKFNGFIQLKQHHKTCQEHRLQANTFNKTAIMRQALNRWRRLYLSIQSQRSAVAHRFHDRLILRRYFSNWTRWRRQMEILTNKAERHYTTRLVTSVFQEWLDLVTREKVAGWEKERVARQHDVMRSKRWVLRTLKSLPEQRRLETEREKRRQEMRLKVANLIPDFQGLRTSNESGS